MLDRDLTAEELGWAQECAAAGDPLAEIAEELRGIDAAALQARLGLRFPLNETQREAAALWGAGCTLDEVAAQLGLTGARRSATVSMRLRVLRDGGYRLRRGAVRPARSRKVLSDRAPQTPRPPGVTNALILAEAKRVGCRGAARRLGVSAGVTCGVVHRARQAEREQNSRA